MKQTAVQWLIEQLEERGHIIPDHLETMALQKEEMQTKVFVEKVAYHRWHLLHRAEGNYQWITEGSYKEPRAIIKTEELLKKYFYE